MYQFPDHPEIPNEFESQPPISKNNRLKVIVIANVLLALFIAGVIWLLFFFNTHSHTSSASEFSSIKTDSSIGKFTPVIVEDDTPIATPAETKAIATIIETPTINTNDKADTKKALTESEDFKENTAGKIETAQSIPPIETLSDVDIIAQELQKNQLALTQDQGTSSTKIDTNQVVLEHKVEQPLSQLISSIKETLLNPDKSLEQQPDKKTILDNQQSDENKADIYNSISLQKASDIDKIMAAMGATQQSPKTDAINIIEKKVETLLEKQKDSGKKPSSYVVTLLPESEINTNEVRTITVQDGETLWDITIRAYGDGNEHNKILDANPLIKDDPSLLKPGITLRVPL